LLQQSVHEQIHSFDLGMLAGCVSYPWSVEKSSPITCFPCSPDLLAAKLFLWGQLPEAHSAQDILLLSLT